MMHLPAWAVWLDVPRAPDRSLVRHRVFYGGRGGAKSWTAGYKLLERGRKGPLRILALREIQNSIRDSSKRLMEDIIDRLGWGAGGDGFYAISEHEIRGRSGTLISFLGLNGKESSIKSFEGIDLVWVEEAASVSQSSIDALIPTIRKPGSEIWWTYNPRFPTDPVDVMFRCAAPPPGSIVTQVQGCDNPWFPPVLKREMDYDQGRDPDKYAHIWRGAYLERSEARVFNNTRVCRFDTPEGAAFFFGVDWGYSVDPTVLVRCFIGRWEGEPGASAVIADSKGKVLFIDMEAYRIGCAIEDTPALFAGSDTRSPPRWRNPQLFRGVPGAARGRITADSARPETIDYMRTRGFNIAGARKGPGSVQDGIEFLRSYDIVVHPDARHLIDELVHYSWATDRQTGKVLPKLKDDHNHVIDALRYALEGVRRTGFGETTFASAGPRVASGAFSLIPHDHELAVRSRQQRTRFSVPSRRSGIMD